MDELHLLMWLLLLIVSTVPLGQYVIRVPAANKADSDTVQDYLCGNGSHFLQSLFSHPLYLTTLYLDPSIWL